VVLVDYARYAPSYEAPAGFIASPIFDGGEKIGVAIFQMPIDRLNTIMGERAGLGRTGETYLVGPDELMRSDSYLDPENHSVVASFKRPATGKVSTAAAKAALAGNTGAEVIMDYNGHPVLSA
jgi:methyl-accepting chemotaxis protein